MTAQTFSFLAPSAGQIIAAPDGTIFTANAFGLITGVDVAYVSALNNAGCILLGAGTINSGAAWNTNKAVPQVLAAVGASQGNAGKVTSNRVTVSAATASTEGVIIEAVATGAVTEIAVTGSFNVKVYPPVGGQFDGVTSINEAKLISKNKSVRIIQRSATAYELQLSA